jgi:hypothetical protein
MEPLIVWCHFGAGDGLFFTDAAQQNYHCVPGSSARFECSGASVIVRCGIDLLQDLPDERREFRIPCKSAKSAALLQQRLHMAVVCGWEPERDILRLQDIRTHFFRDAPPAVDLAADMERLGVGAV